ncbi:AAA family ATPase, putative [Plasmodium gallinaceum]|uniref:AAA family ATPase, putative n=1 Tax=Plasmodium gallinaceum TaxID=5849 RepID=A0A1J1GZV4_PLAGA|nr:AAA family ATPase, putative [Plasmodium gallinaceum]CRG98150.1 AAA family ATPase, putative [Plasmodium gallinaceum]
MNGINDILTNESIYNKILEKEKDCFQEILLNEIWDIYENKLNENELNNYDTNKNVIDINNFIFSNPHNNIFKNYEDLEDYNSTNSLLNDNEITKINNKIENNSNFISGIKSLDIKNFMNFNPLFIKIYHEKNNNENKSKYNIQNDSTNIKKFESDHEEGKQNENKSKSKIDSDEDKKGRSYFFSEDSDDAIYTPKALKLKKKKKNYLSDEDSDIQKSSKKKDTFSNAYEVLVKRKNEKNEEAIQAFNYINEKKRNRNVLKNNNNKNGIKDEKKKSSKKNNDDSNDGYDEIPEKYWPLIDQGVEVNIIRYALSMKMSSNEQVKESDIIGLYDIKKIIKDKIVNAILRPDLFTGLNRAAKGILLFGPPGTGKTMIAKWVASFCKCSFYNVNTSSLFSKYIGETEKIVTSLFKCAELDNPSILFFDEIDSLLGARKKDEDDTTIRIKNQLLQMIDGINTKKDIIIVIIGATNRPDMIDDAALRRFNKRVYIPLPDFQARKEQIRYIISKHTHSGFKMTENELDTISVKLEHWNGSDIYHLCSKCYEYVYDDAIEQYNGIQNIPSTSSFRAIKYDDFIKAMTQVNTSYKNVFDYDEWSKMHSSL